MGLQWQMPEKMQMKAKLVNYAAEIDENFNVVARVNKQYGFAAVTDTDWKNFIDAPSICAAIKTDPTFFGVFHLENPDGKDFWWIFIRIDNKIVEHGDSVFDTFDDAMIQVDVFHRLTDLEPLIIKNIHASFKWIEEHCKYTLFDKSILGKGYLSNLNQMASRVTKLRITAFLVIVAVFATLIIGNQMLKAKRQRDIMEKQRLATQQKRGDIEAFPGNYFAKPWQNKPTAVDIAESCLPAMMSLPLASNGWEMTSAVCTGKKMDLEWSYSDGASFILLPKDAHLDQKDRRKAHSTIPLNMKQTKRVKDGIGTFYSVLYDREEVTGMISEITQSSASFLAPFSFKPQETKQVEKINVVCPWHTASWELSRVPDLFMKHEKDGGIFVMLNEIPGLTLDSITYAKGSWMLKGNVYAKH